MARLYDMAQMTVASAPGTGPITLLAAAVGDGITYLTLAQAGAVDGDLTSYRIRDGTAWEVGHGVVGGGTTTLTRVPFKSSAGGAAINASASAVVMIAPLAEDFNEKTFTAGLTATGVDQTTALQLTAQFSVITGVAAGLPGVKIPLRMITGGESCRVANYGGGPQLLVYPLSGQTIMYAGINNGLNEAATLNNGAIESFESAGSFVYMWP